MHPDRFVAVEVERDRKIPEPLRKATDVLVVAQRLIEKVRRGHHEDDRGEKAIEEIHANLRERKLLR
jgi:Cdc6-like AAA superfamily ATPase